MGRRAHQATDERKEKVRLWAVNGVDHEKISRALRISSETLRKYYRAELDAGDGIWEADFEKCLKRRVLREDCPPVLQIFLAKVKLGYREVVALDPEKATKRLEDYSDDELATIIAERARGRRSSAGSESGVKAAQG